MMRINIFEGARRIALAIGALWALGCVAYAVFSEPNVLLTYAVAWPGSPAVRAEDCGSESATEHVSATTDKGKSIRVILCFTAQKAESGSLLVPYASRVRGVTVRLPNGMLIKDVPEGMTRAELAAKLKVIGYDVPSPPTDRKSVPFGSNPWEQFPRVPSEERAALTKDPPLTLRGMLYTALREADAQGDKGRALEIAEQIRVMPPLVYMMNGPYSSEVIAYTREVGKQFVLPPEGNEDAENALRSAWMEQWKQAAQFLAGGLVVGWALVACIGWIVRGFMRIPRGADARPAV